jgi:hypothetical protein
VAPSVSVFADTGNIFHCVDARFPGRRLNYKKLLSDAQELYTGGRRLKLDVAKAFGTYVNPGVKEFEQSLRRIGWDTKFVPPRSQGQPFDWAVEIALDIYECESDVVVLCSSGHEYLPLVQRLRECNDVEIIVMACGINDKVRSASHRAREIHEGFLTDDRSSSGNSEAPTT